MKNVFASIFAFALLAIPSVMATPIEAAEASNDISKRATCVCCAYFDAVRDGVGAAGRAAANEALRACKVDCGFRGITVNGPGDLTC